MAWSLTTRQAILAPCWNLSQLIVTGTLDRFPELRIYFAETNASWLPTALYQMDENYGIYEHQFETKLSKLPSEYFREHVLVSFIRDEPVADELDVLPVDNLMWGSDFPHSVGSWPKSREWIDRVFGKASDDVMRKILVGTAAGFFGLDLDAELTPTPAPAAV
jgi:predicted TIM-barrel fold metal-dependent hydrolase